MIELEAIILGRKWKAYYQETAGAENIGGVCYFPSREIYIRNDLKGEELEHVVLHELTHAFMYELGQGQNQLRTHHFDEEFICEFVAIHGETVVTCAKDFLRVLKAEIKRSDKIYREINRGLKEKNDKAE